MATKRLGKGLSALIADIQPEEAQQAENLREINVSQISPNPFQPRTEFDPVALEELKNSIAEKGIITPITVRPHGKTYQLIAGERRLRAVQSLGLATIPAFVLDVDSDEDMLEMALIENIQRENLNPIEEANAYQRLIDECNLTQDEAAKRVGKERATVANFLRLLKLPVYIQESLQDGQISAGHARALLSCDSDDDRKALWQRIIKEGLNVRQAEKAAKQGKALKPAARKKAAETRSPELAEAENQLRQIFGTQVHIQAAGTGGKIELEFYNEGDLERLLDMLLSTKNS